jgi:hypothetical protein
MEGARSTHERPNTQPPGLRFRTLLTESGAEWLELARA